MASPVLGVGLRLHSGDSVPQRTSLSWCIITTVWAQLSRTHDGVSLMLLEPCCPAATGPGEVPGRADQPTKRASYPGAPGGSAPFPPGLVSSDPAAARQGGTGRPGGSQSAREPLPDGKTQTSCLCGTLGSLKTLSLPPFGTATAPTPQIPLWFHYGEERQGAPPSAPQPAATATTLSKATGLTQL